MGALYRAGFANQPNSDHAYDGLKLRDAFITAICRCAPPDNKPTPEEILNCRPYLAREFELQRHARVVIALGKVACDGYLAYLRRSSLESPLPRVRFGHGAMFPLGALLPTLICSYHPSQQNTNTGRLTDAMLDEVFEKGKEISNS